MSDSRRGSAQLWASPFNQAGSPSRRRSSVLSIRTCRETQPAGVVNQNDETIRRMSETVPNLGAISKGANAAAENERSMSIKEGIRLYPIAILFSMGLSLAVIMEGYDTALLNSFWQMDAFAKKFGTPTIVDGQQEYVVSAGWQSGLNCATQGGQIIGLLINGIVSERIGYRYTMMGALVFLAGTIFIFFFAVDIGMLLAGYILSGLPWGVFQTLSTTYAAEVTPVALRPFLTTYVSLCWVVGQLIASGVTRAFVNSTSQWAWRVPYAIQWIWPIPIFTVALFAPESPWWLVRHGKVDMARRSLERLTSKKHNPDFNVEDTLAMMIHTNELEVSQTAGTTYLDCFKGFDLRRTELTVATWFIQQTCGSPMIGWGTYFMTLVGLSKSDAYDLGVAQSAMGFVGTIGSWFLMPRFGRRTIYLTGQFVMLLILLAIGGCGIPAISDSTGWAIGGLILALTFVYDITIGPVCYSLVAELPSTRLRIKTVVLARNAYNIGGIVQNILQPHMMNVDSWNWGGKSAFLWAGTNVGGLIWTYLRLPEPKGLTYAELDILFENKISARNFRKFEIDPYRSTHFQVNSETSSQNTAVNDSDPEKGLEKSELEGHDRKEDALEDDGPNAVDFQNVKF